MPIIFNLAGALQLKSIYTEVIPNFATLLRLTDSTVLPTCCPGIFHQVTDIGWVAMQYPAFTRTIERYKHGELNSSEFLDALLAIFPFLIKEGLKYDDELKQNLLAEQDKLFTLQAIPDIGNLANSLIAKALLEKAWNSLIGFNDTCRDKVARLIEEAKTQPVYLISNTNHLNMHMAVQHLKQAFPDTFSIDLSAINPGKTSEPIKLAHNIYLCSSYVYGLYKSDGLIVSGKLTTSTQDLTFAS